MLLLCAALAVMAAGGIQIRSIGFAGGLTAPMVSAIIGIALAGGLVASSLTISKFTRKTAMVVQDVETSQDNRLDTADCDETVFCNPLLDDYFAGIRDELTQVDRLAVDAVSELVASFKHISNLTRSQQDISLAIAAVAAPAEPIGQLLERQKMVAEQIEQELDAAVTALQFGDLIAQLLNHTMVRVDAIGTALRRIDLLDAGQNDGEHLCKPWQFHQGVTKAVMLANTASRARPVVERGMQTGAIELF